MNLLYRLLLIALFINPLPSIVLAQKVLARLDREKILIGEQVTLQLKLEDISSTNQRLSLWFELPDTVNHIEVVKRLAIDTIVIGERQTFIQNIILTSFDSGKWQLPPLAAAITDKTGKVTNLTASVQVLEVLPVDVSSLQEYHDIKDILEVKKESNWLLIIAITCSVLLAGLLIFWWLKQKKKPNPPVKKISKNTMEWALQELELLRKNGLGNSYNPIFFYMQLDKIYRTYLDEQLQLKAINKTSNELSIRLTNVLKDKEQQLAFFQVLRLTSAVKFAKYQALQEEAQQSLQVTKTVIEYLVQQKINQNA